MMISRIMNRQSGNSAIVVIIMVLVFLVLFTGIMDMCRILIGRERTRNAADAIALAIAQEMIFLEYQELNFFAEEIAGRYGCKLESVDVTYDMVSVSVVSEIELLLLVRFREDTPKIIRSMSAAEIIYPWDTGLGLCRYYEFNFKDLK